MPFFCTTVDGLETGATANTYKTILSLKMGATAGHRARLRRLVVTGGGGAPQDLQASIRLRRSNNTTDGTSTAVSTDTIGKKESASVASNVAAIGKNFSAEPTAIENGILDGASLNCRVGVVLEWNEDNAPVWINNQALLIQAAPGEASTARLQASPEWEEF